MEFRKMLMISLYAKQKKRHRSIEQSFGLCGRRRGWDVSREQHRNMYIIQGETDHQPRLDACDKHSDLVHWEDLEGLVERDVGGGIGMGNTCKPMADSCQCMTKPTTVKNNNNKNLFSSPRFAVEAWSSNHWSTGEVHDCPLLNKTFKANDPIYPYIFVEQEINLLKVKKNRSMQ